MLYRFDGGAQTEQTPASVSVTTSRTNPGVSGKVSETSETAQENAGKNETAEGTADAIAKAEAEVDTSPTDAQKEAGNYRKGHVRIDGYDITIENPKGSERSGTDAKGNRWTSKMNNTYGYIRGTEGVDGDHIDVFLSDDPTTGDVLQGRYPSWQKVIPHYGRKAKVDVKGLRDFLAGVAEKQKERWNASKKAERLLMKLCVTG